MFNKFNAVLLLPGQIIRHLIQRPALGHQGIGLKSVLSGSQARPDDSRGFLCLVARELARRRGQMKKTRGAIAHREALGKDNAKRMSGAKRR